jgi:hypothetical protein
MNLLPLPESADEMPIANQGHEAVSREPLQTPDTLELACGPWAPLSF